MWAQSYTTMPSLSQHALIRGSPPRVVGTCTTRLVIDLSVGIRIPWSCSTPSSLSLPAVMPASIAASVAAR